MPGRDQDLAAAVIWRLPASSLASGSAAHPVEPIGEVRSGTVATDEETEESLTLVARGRGTRTLPESAGQAVVLCAHGTSRSFPGAIGHGRAPGRPILTFVTAGELAQQTTLFMYTISCTLQGHGGDPEPAQRPGCPRALRRRRFPGRGRDAHRHHA